MIIEKLNERYVEDAVSLAQQGYNNERKYVDGLYEKDFKEILTSSIAEMFRGRYGAVAVEKGSLVGYLSFWGGINGQFGNVKGSFSPLFANAIGGDSRGKTASLLFQRVSEDMVKDGICSFAVCTYSHDHEIMDSLVMNGFGVRCADAIRRVDKPIHIQFNRDHAYEEIHYSNAGCLLSLKNSLVRHLRESPTYFPNNEFTAENFTAVCSRRQSRFFVAKDGVEAIGYIEIMKDGENFITEAPDMLNICGAYLIENYRGKNILQSLLSFALETLRDEGTRLLGVDCETINPTAFRFWGKYFDNYTYSFIRRIDERIISE